MKWKLNTEAVSEIVESDLATVEEVKDAVESGQIKSAYWARGGRLDVESLEPVEHLQPAAPRKDGVKSFTITYSGVLSEVLESDLPSANAVLAAIEADQLRTNFYDSKHQGHVEVTGADGVRAEATAPRPLPRAFKGYTLIDGYGAFKYQVDCLGIRQTIKSMLPTPELVRDAIVDGKVSLGHYTSGAALVVTPIRRWTINWGHVSERVEGTWADADAVKAAVVAGAIPSAFYTPQASAFTIEPVVTIGA